MPTEQQTLIVSVHVDSSEDSRMRQIGAHVGEGWHVLQTLPLSGEEAGPGGASEDFMRYQVIVAREIDSENVIVGADRGGAADVTDIAATALFDPPADGEDDLTGGYVEPGSGLSDN